MGTPCSVDLRTRGPGDPRPMEPNWHTLYMYIHSICLIRHHGYYLFHHATLCGYYSRAVFIKLGKEDEEIHCLKEGGVAADAREPT